MTRKAGGKKIEKIGVKQKINPKDLSAAQVRAHLKGQFEELIDLFNILTEFLSEFRTKNGSVHRSIRRNEDYVCMTFSRERKNQITLTGSYGKYDISITGPISKKTEANTLRKTIEQIKKDSARFDF